LGRPGAHWIVVGGRYARFPGDPLMCSALRASLGSLSPYGNVGVDALALYVVGKPRPPLRPQRRGPQGAFHLGRSQAVPDTLDNVIHAAV